MGAQLAKPSYHAGPEDELIVKDVYKQNSSAVVNSYQEKHQSSDWLDALGGLNPQELLGKIKGLGQNPLGALGAMVGELGLGGKDGIGALAAALGNVGKIDGLSGALGAIGRLGIPGLEGVAAAIGRGGDLGAIARQALGNALGGLGVGSNIINQITSGHLNGLESALRGQIDQVLRSHLGVDSAAIQTAIDRWMHEDQRSSQNALNGAVSDQNSLDRVRVGQRIENLSQGSTELLNLIRDVASMGHDETKLPWIEDTRVRINDHVQTLSADEKQRLQPLVALINHVQTQASVVIDQPGRQAALISEITLTALDAGLQGTFSHLVKGIEDPEIVQRAALPVIARAIEQGDFSALEDVVNVGGVVKHSHQEMTVQMGQRMQRPTALAHKHYPEYWEKVSDCFEHIDPRWKYTQRGHEVVVNACAVGFNVFMTDLIRSQKKVETDDCFLLLAPLFAGSSVDYCLQRDFPLWYQACPDTPFTPV